MTEDSAALDRASPGWSRPAATNGQLPVLEAAEASVADAAESASLLRRFHHGAAVSGFEVPEGVSPALLYPAPEARAGVDGGEVMARALDEAARHRFETGHADFRGELATLVARLRSLLAVEQAKEPGARAPDALGRAVGGAGLQHLDPEALARVVGPGRGTAPTSQQRRKRLENAIAVLRGYLAAPRSPVVTLVVEAGLDGRVLPAREEWVTVEHPSPCEEAAAIFDREAARMVDVFRARRTALLELQGAFDEVQHQPWLDALDWQALSRDEIRQLPPVVALETAERLVRGQLSALTQLLVSGRPVQVLVLQDPAHNATTRAGAPLADYRLEVGSLAMGHRQALVHQSTAARPEHLAAGFARGMSATRASVHVLASGVDAPERAAAAIEARAHPLFCYDPEGGGTRARRLDFDGNPQPELPWPVYPLRYRRNDGSVGELSAAFTFADFALLDPAFRAHFAVVPEGCPEGLVVPLADYLQLGDDETSRPLPFVWGVAPEGALLRLVITQQLVLACLDRAGFWRTLQELAGVHDDRVEPVAPEVQGEVATVDREAELQQVRELAIEEAMRNLAASLLEVDAEEFVSDVAALAPAVAAPPAAGEPAPAAEPAPEPVSAAPAAAEGPWVESALCTSCNDCVQINRQLFVYDDNKQVKIGDPRAGTFAQLVKAAEKCPARCIHPGEPLNPSEPGLDGLRRRAAPFNE